MSEEKMWVCRKKIVNGTEFAEVAVAHEHLPLKNQNWSERWTKLTKSAGNLYEEIFEFDVRDGDVFLVGMPKSGTTWLQEAVWLLMNKLDFERAKSEDVMQRTMLLELFALHPTMINSKEICEKMPSPRFIKSHLPLSLLPKQIWQKKSKIIYIARNPKDVMVSSFHFNKGLGMVFGDIDQYVQSYVNNEINYGPIWQHFAEFWQLRNESHIFFITYEEMKRDLASVIQRLCVFLERPQLKEEEMKQILEHLSFDAMKANEHCNSTGFLKSKVRATAQSDFQFMRRGVVGSYKNDLTEENQKIFNDWIRKSLAKIGIKEEEIFGKA